VRLAVGKEDCNFWINGALTFFDCSDLILQKALDDLAAHFKIDILM
jgi:hypothetical protein